MRIESLARYEVAPQISVPEGFSAVPLSAHLPVLTAFTVRQEPGSEAQKSLPELQKQSVAGLSTNYRNSMGPRRLQSQANFPRQGLSAMPETTPPSPVVARPSKPVSEALLNEKVC